MPFKAPLGRRQPGSPINFGISEWRKTHVGNAAPFKKPLKDFL